MYIQCSSTGKFPPYLFVAVIQIQSGSFIFVMGNGAGIAQQLSDGTSEFPTRLLTLSANIWPRLPECLVLRLSPECIDVVYAPLQKLICNIIYTDIDSWTTGPKSFLLNFKSPPLASLTFAMDHASSKQLASNILNAIVKLMSRMENEGYAHKQFPAVLEKLVDSSSKQLKSGWAQILGTDKKLTAFQALDIYAKLNGESEFDRMDSICHLYSLLLNKSMFQLLVNALDVEGERDNVLHRLKLQRNPIIAAEGVVTMKLVEPSGGSCNIAITDKMYESVPAQLPTTGAENVTTSDDDGAPPSSVSLETGVASTPTTTISS